MVKKLKPKKELRVTIKQKAVDQVKKATIRFQEMELPIHLLIPNLVTIAAICMGLSAVRFAYLGKTDYAVLSILAAAFFDGIDGRLARLLKAESEFGAQFDSLSDFAAFGVAPAFVLYFSILKEIPGWGWTICLFFAVCQSLRLARYNTYLHQKKRLPANFFVGVPAPMGALVALYPTILGFVIQNDLPALLHGFFLLFAGGLMVSRIPTFSIKSLHLTRAMQRTILLIMAFSIAALINATWSTLLVLITLYLLTLPLSWANFQHKRNPQAASKLPWPFSRLKP